MTRVSRSPSPLEVHRQPCIARGDYWRVDAIGPRDGGRAGTARLIEARDHCPDSRSVSSWYSRDKGSPRRSPRPRPPSRSHRPGPTSGDKPLLRWSGDIGGHTDEKRAATEGLTGQARAKRERLSKARICSPREVSTRQR